MKRQERITLKVGDNIEGEDYENDEVVAYLTLPDHPGACRVVVMKNVRLRDLIGNYTGPDLFFDFDEHNVLMHFPLKVFQRDML